MTENSQKSQPVPHHLISSIEEGIENIEPSLTFLLLACHALEHPIELLLAEALLGSQADGFRHLSKRVCF